MNVNIAHTVAAAVVRAWPEKRRKTEAATHPATVGSQNLDRYADFAFWAQCFLCALSRITQIISLGQRLGYEGHARAQRQIPARPRGTWRITKSVGTPLYANRRPV
jgi:hypothetical protein